MLRVAEDFAKTDTGRQRPANEDAYLARAPVFVVADGMGGAQAGEVASRIAVEMLEPGLPDRESPERALAERVQDANGKIYALSRSDHRRAGMGTTISAVHVGEHELAIAHVGDSRVYVLRDGTLTRLTRDHSLVAELVRRGRLTEEEAEEHPQRSIITRALGPEPIVEVDTQTYPARDGDVFLLCSDGLTSMVHEPRIAETLLGAGSLREAGELLVREANEAGGRDNVTVVLMRLEEVRAPAGEDQPTVISAAVPEPEPAPSPPAVTRAPRAPASPASPSARASPRRRVRLAVAGALAAVLALLLGAGWVASRGVYFIGADPSGQVAIYRGLPYELPGGIDLYETEYVSGVPVLTVPVARRRKLLDHQLRSQGDAADLVRRIERGELAS